MLGGKICAVVGGSRGIGRAISIRMAREGAVVVIGGRDIDVAREVTDEIRKEGGVAHAVQLDIRHEESVKSFFDWIEDQLGRLDILINNAGVCYNEPFLETSVERFDDVINTNLRGTFLCCLYGARLMARQRYGRIINVTSPNAVVGAATAGPYCASKAGINLLTKTMAIELAPYNITVNGFGPGFTRTRLTEHLIQDAEFMQRFMQHIPSGVVMDPEDVVGACVFLASDDARFVNGHILYVDGGFLAT